MVSQKRRILSSALLCAALTATLAIAQPQEQISKVVGENAPTVLKTVKLKPQVGTEVALPDFKATFYSDGKVRVGSAGTYSVNAPTQVIQFEVDTVKGTYKTKVVSPEEYEERTGLRLKSNDLLINKNFRGGATESDLPAKNQGDWWGSVKVKTLDPVTVDLTATTTELAWRVFWDGTVNWLWTVRSCWAANPSALGTHWFVDSCQRGIPWFASWTKVCNQTSGSYHNTDFPLSDNHYADQWTLICGRNDAMFEYNWTHEDMGPFSGLIFGWLVLNEAA